MKTWLITGASSGFGQAFANAALEHGDSVVATFRNAAQAKAFEAGAPGAALGLVMDVTDSRAVEAGIAAGLERFGRIDVLVNNAGYALRAPIEQTSDQEALDQLNVNVLGVLRVTRAVLPVMRQQGGGRIINMCSLSGTIAFPTLGFYAVSKAGVMLLSETLAQEVSGQGIFVTCVEPGGFRTNFGGSSMVKPASDVPEPYAQLVATMDANMAKFGEFASGDPKLAAKKIIELAEMTAPPVRVALGDDALPTLRHALEKRLDEYEGSAALGQGTSAS